MVTSHFSYLKHYWTPSYPEVCELSVLRKKQDQHIKMSGEGDALLSMQEKINRLRLHINQKADEREKYVQHLHSKKAEMGDKDLKELETTIKAMGMEIEAMAEVADGMEGDLRKARSEMAEREGDDSDIDEEEDYADATGAAGGATRSTPGIKKRTYSKDEVQQMLRAEREDKRFSAMESRMDRLITALHDSSTRSRGRSRSPPSSRALPSERKRTLGTAPSFITGETDFMIFVESFEDYCSLNEINDANKRKRLFLMALDQTARMRCAGLSPDEPPCLGMSAEEYITRVKELFVPKATMLVVQQAFHELKQRSTELPVDFLMNKFARFRRGWSSPSAPFSFFYEAATAGLYDEQLRKEVYRKIITCDNSNDKVEVNRAFQEYVEHVQVCVGYLRRTAQGNPDSRGLAVTGQSSKTSRPANVSEVDHFEDTQGIEQFEYWPQEEEEADELDEQQIAFVEAMEDHKFTQLIEQDAQMIEEAGNVKLCFLCKSPYHLARACKMRLNNLSGAMERMGFVPRGSQMRGGRGARRGRGSWGRARGRTSPLGGSPATLPPPAPLSMRPVTSTQPGAPYRGGNF